MLHALKCKCVTAERSVFMSAHAPRMSVLVPRRFLAYGSNAREAGSRGWVIFFFFFFFPSDRGGGFLSDTEDELTDFNRNRKHSELYSATGPSTDSAMSSWDSLGFDAGYGHRGRVRQRAGLPTAGSPTRSFNK